MPRELAKLGADLVLNGFGHAGEIEAIRSRIERDHGVRVVYDGADMSQGDAVRGLVAATIAKFGRPLDILVNNAGIQHRPVEEFPPEKWDAILAINLLGLAFHGIAAAAPQMKGSDGGASSTSPPRMASSSSRTRPRTSRPSTGLSA